MADGEVAFRLLLADRIYQSLPKHAQRQVLSVFATKDEQGLKSLIKAGELDMPTSQAFAGLFDHALEQQQGVQQEQTYADWLSGLLK